VSHPGLCPFSGLVCDLLLRQLREYVPEGTWTEGHSESQSERALLGGHQSRDPLPSTYPSRGATMATGDMFLGS